MKTHHEDTHAALPEDEQKSKSSIKERAAKHVFTRRASLTERRAEPIWKEAEEGGEEPLLTPHDPAGLPQSINHYEKMYHTSVSDLEQERQDVSDDLERLLEDEEAKEEPEEEFSPLSHNPLATEDYVRPSDLMLLALTERIAAKVRVKVGKDLDAHIQNKIYPLLDEFADQLVKHLEVDLLKMIREGIAEATREELERLSHKSRK